MPPAEATGRRSGERGFTLLEIVVALAIAGLALVGLFRAGSGGIAAVGNAGQVQEAAERAQSRLAAIGRLDPIVAGDTEGDDGGGYHWQVSARPVSNWQVGPAGSAVLVTLYEIEVTISWQAGSRRRSIVLQTLRLG
jgi:general secretion pathway protein I